MIGGKIFLIEPGSEPGEFRVIVKDDNDCFCYVYVNFHEQCDGYSIIHSPKIGDIIWWQGKNAYWTSQQNKNEVVLNRRGLACNFKRDVYE